MKVFSFYTTLGLAAIVGQTTILRLTLFQDIFYDLLIPLVVFVRLNLPEKKAGVLVLLIGFLMDLSSGGIFGIYISVYFWIFVLLKGISNYFDVQGAMSRSLLIAVCVLAENLLFFFTSSPSSGIELLISRIGPVVGQTVFAAITGPAVLLALEKIQERLEYSAFSGKKQRGIL
ncbi:MAG: hypothetical protein HWN68_03095 [Desulfobacterales bacterium]|nr:hypothetical protein [Desulfobacterales bacterium]